ncbi:PepSY-associated TM helix domain-containing protein [Solimonas variicoloris]|uniref:PepSY-associated TM helix domain-containing protein n=1 Tax=Solimonas variicoloris TaxID=254408 RepID=UPI0003693AF9|nr:PepSY-associated TM helix domain-containing protein [Solimonas variicoloris]
MTAAEPALAAVQRRAWWLKTLRQWHWISSAVCLVAMLLFAVTGITLNHAAQIKTKPIVTKRDGQVPHDLRAGLDAAARDGRAPLPEALRDWLARELGVHAEEGEWSADELYLSLPRPGGDAWLTIALPDGAWQYERTDRGWIAWLNDLHKGRNTGAMWTWFIDLFAVACVLFCVTGLCLLQLHAGRRPATWPMVGLGVLIPLLFILLFLH